MHPILITSDYLTTLADVVHQHRDAGARVTVVVERQHVGETVAAARDRLITALAQVGLDLPVHVDAPAIYVECGGQLTAHETGLVYATNELTCSNTSRLFLQSLNHPLATMHALKSLALSPETVWISNNPIHREYAEDLCIQFRSWARLVVFDLDGTLITSYMVRPDRVYAPVELLPGVASRIAALEATGARVAIATNQGGVAFGLVSPEQVAAKLTEVGRRLGYGAINLCDGTGTRMEPTGHPTGGTLPVFACFADARSPQRSWRDADAVARRKPSGVMIREAMAATGVDAIATLYVGDRPEDEQAAADAGVSFMWARDYVENVEITETLRLR